MNPRTRIENLVKEHRLTELLDIAASLHGHYCPGLAMGVLAASDAMKRLAATSDGLEDILALTETNNCFSDGIQLVTGCTFGNNGLIFKDLGKTAFTLAMRNGRAVRYTAKPGGRDRMRESYTSYSDLYQAVVAGKSRDPEVLREYFRLGRLRALAVLELEVEDLFNVHEAEVEIPSHAPSLPSLSCDSCGEEMMEGRTAEIGNSTYCLTCAGREHGQLTGHGIHIEK